MRKVRRWGSGSSSITTACTHQECVSCAKAGAKLSPPPPAPQALKGGMAGWDSSRDSSKCCAWPAVRAATPANSGQEREGGERIRGLGVRSTNRPLARPFYAQLAEHMCSAPCRRRTLRLPSRKVRAVHTWMLDYFETAFVLYRSLPNSTLKYKSVKSTKTRPGPPRQQMLKRARAAVCDWWGLSMGLS